MKQFNLEEYLKNPSKNIVTRDGRDVRIICTDKRGTNFPIVALIECEDKEETCYYTKKGYWNSCEVVSKIDLFFAPEKHEGWANMYKNPDETNPYMGGLYNSEEEAREKIGLNDLYLRTVKIEWEE